MNIEIKNLTKLYGNNLAVNNLSLDIPSGGIYGFIGANGAGKTTTMKMLVGLLKKDGGEVFINNKKINYLDEKLAKNNKSTTRGGLYSTRQTAVNLGSWRLNLYEIFTLIFTVLFTVCWYYEPVFVSDWCLNTVCRMCCRKAFIGR